MRPPISIKPLVASVVSVVIFVSFASVVSVLGGCGDGGRGERRAQAHELAGRWQGAEDVDLVVEDEADKNDVVVTLTRPGGDLAEARFVERLADPSVALRLVLGTGIDGVRDEVDGGENVSFDGGATSTLSVTGADVDADASPGAHDATLRWSLALQTDADDADRLAGLLRVSLRERRPRAGDSDGFSTETDQALVDVDVRRE